MKVRVHQVPPASGVPQPTDRAVRLPEVIKITGRSRSVIYDDIRNGRFPAGFLIGRNARAWMLNADIMAWLESRKAGVV